MSYELKPCRFCGGEAEIVRVTWCFRGHCKNPKCGALGPVSDYGPPDNQALYDQASKAWNIRDPEVSDLLSVIYDVEGSLAQHIEKFHFNNGRTPELISLLEINEKMEVVIIGDPALISQEPSA